MTVHKIRRAFRRWQRRARDPWRIPDFTWFKRSARTQAPIQYGSEISYRVCIQMRVLIGLTLVLLLGFEVLVVAMVISSPASFVAALIPVPLLIGIMLAAPVPVRVDVLGILQKYWWRPSKRIPWSELATVVRNPKSGDVTVYGMNGVVITFSAYLVDQGGFVREVKARSKGEYFSRGN